MKEKRKKSYNKEINKKKINTSVGGHISGASAKVGSNPESLLDVEDYPL